MTSIIQFALLGIGTGAIYAIFAQSIVAVNLGSGVLNFSAGAVGMIGALLYYDLRGHMLGVIALALALGACAVIGALTHLIIMRPLANSSPMSRIVATLGLMAALLEGVTLFTNGQGATLYVASPLSGATLHIGKTLFVGWDDITIAIIAIVITVLLILARRYTRIGLATCAVAENKLVTSTMGWSPNTVGAVAWAVGSVVAAVGAIVASALSGISPSTLVFLVIPSLAAALVGRFRSFGWTLVGALALGIAASELTRYVTTPGWGTAIPLVAIVIVLVARGTKLPARTEQAEHWPMVGSGRVRRSRLVWPLLAAVVLLLLPVLWLDAFATTYLFAVIILSLVVLTGYAGQLSLAQVSIAGLSAYFTAWIVVETGLPLILAMICAVLVVMPIAIVVALPALRARGYNLAIATLSLATAIDALVISNPVQQAKIEGKSLGQFEIFGLNLTGTTHPEAFAIAAVIVLTALGLVVANVRRGRTGRRMLAVRSNERAAASLGISVAGVKLYAFWLAATIAAIGGAMVEARVANGDTSAFPLIDNINALLDGIIGGIGWIAGALLGALGVPGGVSQQVVSSFTLQGGSWLVFLGGIGAIVIVIRAPNGLAAFKYSIVLWLGRKLPRLRRTPPAESADAEVSSEPATPPQSERHAIERVPTKVLTVRNVTVKFGVQAALSDASLFVRTGEVVGLIGPNGAGKSTLIDVVTGFEDPRQGEVLIDDQSINGHSPAKRAQNGICRTFQNLELFDDMTVLENLRTAGERTTPRHYLTDLVWPTASGLSDATYAAIDEFRLTPYLDRLPSELDYGKRRQVAIARTLSTAPSFVLLDEPAAGLDERERRELIRLIRTVAEKWGIGVLLVEHDVQLVFGVCERVVVLDFGKVIASGSVTEIKSSPAVRKAYLGEDRVLTEEHGSAELVVERGR